MFSPSNSLSPFALCSQHHTDRYTHTQSIFSFQGKALYQWFSIFFFKQQNPFSNNLMSYNLYEQNGFSVARISLATKGKKRLPLYYA